MRQNEIGPYASGAIPLPLTVHFPELAGHATSALAARLVIVGGAEPIVREAQWDAETAEATYVLLAGDMPPPGEYIARMWVGNGTNRFVHPTGYRFSVFDAGSVPAGV
jgi:hypothetical protein